MRPKSTTLTAHELAMMNIVWARQGGVTVREVYEALRKRRTIAYTTVMTTMKTLEQKGYLTASQQDRAYLYRPTRPRHQVVKAMVRDFLDRVFDGSASPLVAHLIEDEQITEADIKDLARLRGKKR